MMLKKLQIIYRFHLFKCFLFINLLFFIKSMTFNENLISVWNAAPNFILHNIKIINNGSNFLINYSNTTDLFLNMYKIDPDILRPDNF